ncbi:MAG: LarC family nickel insertion protein [Endozoicomonas sp.]
MPHTQPHIHLDVSGGIAGDMFAASMLDAHPELKAPLLELLNGLGLQQQPEVTLAEFTDGVLCGKQFHVHLTHHHDHEHDHKGHHHHSHSHWSEIRRWLTELPLEAEARRHTMGIFTHLAEAEAAVHGKSVDDVCFHEVGAWDSIIDILAAGWLIARVGAASWSVSSLPWGGGMAKTDHGLIPVPAPASMQLLKGFEFHDDGIKGERITPTGAAILAWLKPLMTKVSGQLKTYGHGFGTRKLPGMSNVLRVNILEASRVKNGNTVIVMECDIDDQSSESLAVGLDHLRDHEKVIDVVQTPAYGKKGRMTAHLRMLVKTGHQETVAKEVFAQTTTLGIRWHQAQRFELERGETRSETHDIRVKWVDRPGVGKTLKAEMDDIAREGQHHHDREALRREVEQAVSEEL